MKTFINSFALSAMLILLQLTGFAQTQKQQYPAGELNLSDLKTKFFQLCDVTVQRINLPERKYSQDLPVRRVPFYADSYAIRALAVAYDLTGKEEYLTTIKTWADRMITNQEKMIPRGGYYMNYDRAPFQTAGEWFVADCAEISMGMLATAVRCTNPMEKERYLKSVEFYANLVLDNYIGPNGGIRDGLWSQFDGECTFVVGYTGQVFFKLFDETGKKRYLDAGLNAVNWLNNLESIRNNNSKDEKFLKYNPPITMDMSSAQIRVILDIYSGGLSHIFSNRYPEIEKNARKQIALLMQWCTENLCGKGQSGTVEKYDVRKGKVLSKFGGLPFHIYVMANNKIVSADMIKIADKELQRILSEIFSYDELLITEFTSFAMISMAEKISPGAALRNSIPLYKTVGTVLKK